MAYTYAQFVVRVKELMPKDGTRLGTETFIARMIDQAMIDIQSKVEKYRSGNETIYEAADLVDDGYASRARIPDGARIDEAWFIQVDESDGENECVKMPLDPIHWKNRSNITCAEACLNGQRGYMTMDPQRVNMIVYPKVESPNQLLIVWTGIKVDYETTDAVPFNDRCALACADFVQAYAALKVKSDRQLHAAFMESYARTMRSILSEACK
jgi:hypothetical protein